MKRTALKYLMRTFGYTGIILFWGMMVLGCRGKTPPVLFYTLTPMPASVTVTDLRAAPDIRIGVGPVSLPEFLNKPQIATRTGASRIHYAEYHRWGGYLDKELPRVISENLSAYLATDHVKIYPWSGTFDPAYQVIVDVKQFEGEMQENVILNVVWQINGDSREGRSAVLRRSVIREAVHPSSADDYEALAQAQSRALARLSAEIAEAILKF